MKDRAVEVPRAALALTAGAIVGGLLTALLLLAPGLITDFQAYRMMGPWGPYIGVVVAIASFWYFLVGLFVVGAPAWYLAHRLGRTRWFDAMAVGTALMFLVTMFVTTGPSDGGSLRARGVDLMVDGHLTEQGRIDALETSICMAAIGAIVGFVIWWIAYRDVPPRKADDR
jgi:hypothetical protein